MNHIKKRDLLKILFRSFYIQGSWNFERMMGLGLCFCLIPVARRICQTEEEMVIFLKRHLDFFNAQPYMASFALGAITKLEEQAIHQKWKDKQPISVFKERICGPLGALGDAFFWRFLKPLTASIGVIMSLLIGWIGILIFLVLFNMPHFYIRIMGIYIGYKKGFDIIRDLSISKTQKYFKIFYATLNGIIGILIVTVGYWISSQDYGAGRFLIFLFLTIISFGLTIRKKLSIEMIIIIILSISITIGLMI